ncbi:hypothetical protein Dimus_037892 [Dionaea muscipula]
MSSRGDAIMFNIIKRHHLRPIIKGLLPFRLKGFQHKPLFLIQPRPHVSLRLSIHLPLLSTNAPSSAAHQDELMLPVVYIASGFHDAILGHFLSLCHSAEGVVPRVHS